MATPIPHNHACFTTAEIAAATGGRVLVDAEGCTGVSTDTRNVAPGDLFVALAGERFDAHRFLDAAVKAGARCLLVSSAEAVPAGVGAVLVADTRRALGDLAHAHRVRWAATPHPDGAHALVAVTGSAGKTTTRRAIAASLEAVAPGQVLESEGNLNNLVGAPMTLLGLGEQHRFAVVELGTSLRGEIERLAAIAEPDVGVVTLVAVAHTAGLGTVDDVADEKGALFAALGAGRVAVANADDARVVAALARAPEARRITYGTVESADVRVVARSSAHGGTATIASLDGARTTLPAFGEATALAFAAAWAVLEALSLVPVDLPGFEARFTAAFGRTLAAVADEPGRLTPRTRSDGTLVIDDTYNANPASMRASIATAAEAAGSDRRLVLALGEMRELGGLAAEEHAAIGRLVAALRPAHLVAVSGEARRIAAIASAAGIDATFAEASGAAASLVAARVRPGDVVLVKGSRGVAMEAIVQMLLAGEGRAA